MLVHWWFSVLVFFRRINKINEHKAALFATSGLPDHFQLPF